MIDRDDRDDTDPDPAGERGGDTGNAHKAGKEPGAEKGDQRRDKPVHSGPTRQGSRGESGAHDRRSGSDSHASN